MPPTKAHYNGTLIWHPASTPPKLVVTLCSGTLQWHPGTQQWHHIHSRPLPQSWSSPSPPTIAHYNGTLQWHHVHSPKVGRHPPPNHITLQWHPTKAPSNGTTSSASCNGTPWCHVQSAKVVRRPPPLLEVRTPIAIAIWEKECPYHNPFAIF